MVRSLVFPNEAALIADGDANTSFMLLSSALVFIMTPANALTPLLLSFMVYAVVMVQWFLFGFSLALSDTGSPFIGDFTFAAFQNLSFVEDESWSADHRWLSCISVSFYQLQFATVSCILVFGSVINRIRFGPALIFSFFWTSL
eukprot:gene6639-7126_t